VEKGWRGEGGRREREGGVATASTFCGPAAAGDVVGGGLEWHRLVTPKSPVANARGQSYYQIVKVSRRFVVYSS